MQNSFALDAAEMVAQSLAGTRPCHLVQKNGLLPIIKCPSIVGAVVDENTYLADVASERLSISNYAPVCPKKILWSAYLILFLLPKLSHYAVIRAIKDSRETKTESSLFVSSPAG